MEKYARKSDVDGKGMNSGYCFGNGDFYCQNDEQAKQYIESLGLDWKEELSKFNTREEWFYFTEWEEINPEEFFDSEGNAYTTCKRCNKPVMLKSKICKKCFTSI